MQAEIKVLFDDKRIDDPRALEQFFDEINIKETDWIGQEILYNNGLEDTLDKILDENLDLIGETKRHRLQIPVALQDFLVLYQVTYMTEKRLEAGSKYGYKLPLQTIMILAMVKGFDKMKVEILRMTENINNLKNQEK